MNPTNESCFETFNRFFSSDKLLLNNLLMNVSCKTWIPIFKYCKSENKMKQL